MKVKARQQGGGALELEGGRRPQREEVTSDPCWGWNTDLPRDDMCGGSLDSPESPVGRRFRES